MIPALIITTGGILFMLSIIALLLSAQRGTLNEFFRIVGTLAALAGGGLAVLMMLIGVAL